MPEMHTEPCKTSHVEGFAEIINGKIAHYFHKTLHFRCLTRFEYTSEGPSEVQTEVVTRGLL